MTLFSSLSSTPPKKIEIVFVHYYSGIPPTLFFWLPLLAERVLPSPASPRNGGAEKKAVMIALADVMPELIDRECLKTQAVRRRRGRQKLMRIMGTYPGLRGKIPTGANMV
jgi:hypothetical protein